MPGSHALTAGFRSSRPPRAGSPSSWGHNRPPVPSNETGPRGVSPCKGRRGGARWTGGACADPPETGLAAQPAAGPRRAHAVALGLAGVSPASSVFVVIVPVTVALSTTSITAFLLTLPVAVLVAMTYAAVGSRIPVNGGESAWASGAGGPVYGAAILALTLTTLSFILALFLAAWSPSRSPGSRLAPRRPPVRRCPDRLACAELRLAVWVPPSASHSKWLRYPPSPWRRSGSPSHSHGRCSAVVRPRRTSAHLPRLPVGRSGAAVRSQRIRTDGLHRRGGGRRSAQGAADHRRHAGGHPSPRGRATVGAGLCHVRGGHLAVERPRLDRPLPGHQPLAVAHRGGPVGRRRRSAQCDPRLAHLRIADAGRVCKRAQTRRRVEPTESPGPTSGGAPDGESGGRSGHDRSCDRRPSRAVDHGDRIKPAVHLCVGGQLRPAHHQRAPDSWGDVAAPVTLLVTLGAMIAHAVFSDPLSVLAAIGLLILGGAWYWSWSRFALADTSSKIEGQG